jgi:beta-glucosidase
MLDIGHSLGVGPLLLAGVLSAVRTASLKRAEAGKRVEAILKQMTLEEKIDIIGGVNSFYIRGNPRLGLPELKMADGPFGIRKSGPSTTYAAGIALAASWDVDLARRVGTFSSHPR